MTQRIAAASIAFACLIVPAAAEEKSEKDERIQELKVDVLTWKALYSEIKAQLAEAAKRREAALRVSADAQRQLNDALNHAADAKSQRDAARTAATSLRQKMDEETTYLRRQAEQDKAALRQQAAKELSAVRDRADAEVKAITKELSDARLEAVSYKHELQKAQTSVRQYEAENEADRQLSVTSYASGVDQFNRSDYDGAIKSFTAAIEVYPKDARFFYMRALARRNLGTEDDAVADAKRGLTLEQIDSGNTPAVDRALAKFQGASRLWLENYRRY